MQHPAHPTPETPSAECADLEVEVPEKETFSAHSAGGVGRLVAVHAHPDDETLATGALLATWGAAGGHATVVTCTRGEQGEVIGAPLAHLEGDAPALAAHRAGELANALAKLGVAEQHFLDQLPATQVNSTASEKSDVRYADSGMAWLPGQSTGTAGALEKLPDDAFVSADLDETAGRLATFLDRTMPDVVVSYDPGGGYGHPDHVRTHEVTMRAIELSRRASPVVLWASVLPRVLRQQRQQLAHALWTQTIVGEQEFALPDQDGDLPAVADASRAIAVSVPVYSVLNKLLGALKAHATQVQAISAAPVRQATDNREAALLASFSLSNNVLAGIGQAETYAWGTPESAERAAQVRWPRDIDIAQQSPTPEIIDSTGSGTDDRRVR